MQDIVSYYRNKLSVPRIKELEATSGALLLADDNPSAKIDYQLNLSDEHIKERCASTKAELYRIAKEYLGDKPALRDLADKIVADGGEALRAVRNNDNDFLVKNTHTRDALEVVVLSDGSRPSFLIVDGKVDKGSGTITEWTDLLDSSAAKLGGAIACIGRINLGDFHMGTGVLIQENIIMTNHHILEVVSDLKLDGSRIMKASANIGFGFEFRRPDGKRRKLKRAIFYGPHNFGSTPDHSNLDLALIELEPLTGDDTAPVPLAIDLSPNWAKNGQTIYTIGYPGDPSPMDHRTLLDIFFKDTFGCKRLGPGKIIPSQNLPAWTLSHDATTLGGNSGSGVFVVDNEMVAAGLHYGGHSAEPRTNWAHILGATMSSKDAVTTSTLKEVLEANNVELI